MSKIYPAVEEVRATNPKEEDMVDLVIKQNVRNVKKELLEKSQIVREHVEKGVVAIHGVQYSLDTGKVEPVD